LSLYLFIFFCLTLLVQIAYVLKYFRQLLFYKSKAITTNESIPVSIIVAAKNEAKNIPHLIESLMNQTHPTFEVIIVNDRSNDGSAHLLEAASLKHENLRVINIKELPPNWTGKKYALKNGVEASKYDTVLLTDADCLPRSSNWITLMSQQFSAKTKFVLGFSPYHRKKGILNQLIQFETLWTGVQYLSFALAGHPYMGVGRNMAYKKAILLEDSFSKTSHIVGGDDDLLVNNWATAENTKIVIDSDSQTLSIPKTNWSDYFIQKIRHLSVGTHYRKKDRTRLGLFALSNWFGWILLFILLFNHFDIIWTLSIFGIRSILFYTIFTRIGRKLGVILRPFTLPLLDLLYNFFYLVVGLRALTAKRIKWS
jgi:poly-beta-1,6-N-acetyl-D-glucosamine synthase